MSGDALDLDALGVPQALREFAPTRAAGLARLAALQPSAYARSRNVLDGDVSGLSPYFTHGILSMREAVHNLAQRHRLGFDDKLVFEFAWRGFFHHVWQHHGDAILQNMRPSAVWAGRYVPELPPDVREGRTGVGCIDAAVRQLYATGYLHNHARMWLASYCVHVRKVHWRAGADWLHAHLLDGDLASNHLSWQWVAANFSAKPYLFNAGNVAKFAPQSGWQAWVSSNTAVDQSYEALDALARSCADCGPESGQHPSVAEPALLNAGAPVVQALLEEEFAGRLMRGGPLPAGSAGLELVHPWGLSERHVGSSHANPNAAGAALRVAVLHMPAHEAWPWGLARWRFVVRRMSAVCDWLWLGDLAALQCPSTAQATDCSFPHYGAAFTQLAERGLRLTAPDAFFPSPAQPCASFSRYYDRMRREAASLQNLLDLPVQGKLI